MEREGLRVSCHQHYEADMWERIRKKLNEVLKEEGKILSKEDEGKVLTRRGRRKK